MANLPPFIITADMEKLFGLIDGTDRKISDLKAQKDKPGPSSAGFDNALKALCNNGFAYNEGGTVRGTLRRKVTKDAQHWADLIDEANSYYLQTYPSGKCMGENGLYETLRETLRKHFAVDGLHFDDGKELRIVDTSGPKGGKLHNPDITIVGYQKLAGHKPALNVITIEVKPKDEIKPNFATAAQQEMFDDSNNLRATQGYLMFHVPTYRAPDPNMTQIVSAAGALDIGVITFGDPKRVSTWKMESPAEAKKPNPTIMTTFINSLPASGNGNTGTKSASQKSAHENSGQVDAPEAKTGSSNLASLGDSTRAAEKFPQPIAEATTAATTEQGEGTVPVTTPTPPTQNAVVYTDAPPDIEESMDQAVRVPDFLPTPEEMVFKERPHGRHEKGFVDAPPPVVQGISTAE